MPVERTAAIVIGRFPLGESDRVVTFFTRRFGKLRGVARAARRLRSRFGGALEPFTLGDLVLFDNGRHDLVQVDHFDVVRPFDGLRGDLERLGHAAWMTECVQRLTADRDAHAPLFNLLARALASIDTGSPPQKIAVLFGLRAIDALGHRLRIDACVSCGRGLVHDGGRVTIDVEAGGTVCEACARALDGTVSLAASTLAAMSPARSLAWDRAVDLPLGPAEAELRRLLDTQTAALAGQSSRASRFLREVSRTLHGERVR